MLTLSCLKCFIALASINEFMPCFSGVEVFQLLSDCAKSVLKKSNVRQQLPVGPIIQDVPDGFGKGTVHYSAFGLEGSQPRITRCCEDQENGTAINFRV